MSEVDAEIAKLVFESEYTAATPKYSTDIGAAMLVVDRLAHSFGFSAFRYPGFSSAGWGWVVVFAANLRPYSVEIITLGDPTKVFYGHSDSLPEAICKAALALVHVHPRGVYTT